MQSTIRPIDQFMKSLKAARRVSTPLVAIRSADQGGDSRDGDQYLVRGSVLPGHR